MHCNILAQRFITTFHINYHTNAGAVHVAGQIALTVKQFKATHAHVFTQLGDQCLTDIFNAGCVIITD